MGCQRGGHSKSRAVLRPALAAEAGLTLGQTISIRESTFVPSETDFFSDDDGGGGGGVDQGRREAPTEPGRTQVFGTVYVVFEAG